MRVATSVLPLIGWMACVILLTLYPFDFAASDGRTFSEGVLTRRWADVLLNVLLFLPLGAFLHREGRRLNRQLPVIVSIAALIAVLISFAIEYLQLFLSSRFPSVTDIASNSAGAVLGVWMHRAWAMKVTQAAERLRRLV